MKRLANVSPFILLLVPVVMMFVLAFSASILNRANSEEFAAKTNSSTSGKLIKVTSAILR